MTLSPRLLTKKRTTEPPDTTSVQKEKNKHLLWKSNDEKHKDEKILKDIIKKNVKPTNNTQVNNLIMYNNLTTRVYWYFVAVPRCLWSSMSCWRLCTPEPFIYWINKEQCENHIKSTSTKGSHTRTPKAIS